MKASILIVTSVQVERDAIMKGLRDDRRFCVIAAGVGAVKVAANTATELVTGAYQIIINMGIGGGFLGRADVGSVVVATEIIAADLGAETEEGFQSLEQLKLGTSKIVTDYKCSQIVFKGIQNAEISVANGPILTVSTVTGTEETAARLLRRQPGAFVEAMEGYGVAVAAEAKQIPILEIRAISNLVGLRDREQWKVKEALSLLEQVGTVLTEVL